MRPWWLPLLVPFVGFVEFVVHGLRSHGGSGNFDQSVLALVRQPIPHPHDEGKARVFSLGCGQCVGKSFPMCLFRLPGQRVTMRRIQSG